MAARRRGGWRLGSARRGLFAASAYHRRPYRRITVRRALGLIAVAAASARGIGGGGCQRSTA